MTICQSFDNLDRKPGSKKERYVRNLSDENILTFSMALSNQNWDTVINATHVNLAYSNFMNIFCELYDIHCSVTKKKLHNRKET